MNVKKEVTLINEFGETMTLRLDTDNQIWFKHTDCNIEFENWKDLDAIWHVPPKPITAFKYIINKMEQVVIDQFLSECMVIISTNPKLIKEV